MRVDLRVVKLTRDLLAQQIVQRIQAEHGKLVQQWHESGPINHFALDDLLPDEWTRSIHEAFPSREQMEMKRSLRELKLVAAQMDRYHPLLEESIYAFQAPAVLGMVQQITGLAGLEPDELLYAGGISAMERGHFVNPHIDNSHDKFRNRYRVLNLLFYVSPDREAVDGCNLELWPAGPAGKPITIVSRFNRLVVMATHRDSWHSVSPSQTSKSRCCISNYYFSRLPIGDREYFHVTSFRGRPEQPVRDLVLRADIWLRTAIRRIFPHGIRENPHFYRRDRGGRVGKAS